MLFFDNALEPEKFICGVSSARGAERDPPSRVAVEKWADRKKRPVYGKTYRD
jgi:hypothetical protein